MASSDDVAQFVSITGADAETAKFYLDSAGGNAEAALSAYFESGGAMGSGPVGEGAEEEPLDDPDFQPDAAAAPPMGFPSAGAGPSGGAAGRPKRAAAQQGGVRSLGDLKDEEDSDSGGEQGNELFTGGAKSGQVVKGPKKDKKADDVEGLFDRARQAGAVDGTQADLHQGGGGGGGAGGSFSGAARTLAGAAPAAPAEEAGPSQPAAPQPVVHTITFYANGIFTVDDGEPRDMRDPANAPFMNSISRGECPRELEPDGAVPVNVNLVRNGGEYVAPPKPAYTAFSGQGRTLAGPEPTAAQPAAPPPAAAAAAPAAAPQPGTSSAAGWPGPDESAPVTSIQLRLADGSRLVARFNLTQTVGDLRSFIAASRPDLAGTSYRLATAFPAAELTDDAATIQGAGLANAVVVQKPA